MKNDTPMAAGKLRAGPVGGGGRRRRGVADGGTLERESVPVAIARMLPTNPMVDFTERDMLAVVILAAIFGIALRVSPPGKVEILLKLIRWCAGSRMRVIKWAMFLTLVAFSTSSSAAVMPLSKRNLCLECELELGQPCQPGEWRVQRLPFAYRYRIR